MPTQGLQTSTPQRSWCVGMFEVIALNMLALDDSLHHDANRVA